MISRLEFGYNLQISAGGHIYSPAQLQEFLAAALPDHTWIFRGSKANILDCICAFDTEFTSFDMVDEIPGGTVYAWAFAINGLVTVGRSTEEYVDWSWALSKALHLNTRNRLRVYVHNLGADWQYLRRWYEWPELFARSPREPLIAVSDNWMEYRDSLALTGVSLAKWGDSIQRYPIRKLTGDLDYNLPRHYASPLTSKELDYIVHDVLVVSSGIKEKQEQENGRLHKIPLTKTGYARRLVRDHCLGTKGYYYGTIAPTALQVEEYLLARQAFAGGYTHASAPWVGDIIDDCISLDFTSSYPYQMCVGYYPMGAGQRHDIHQLKKSQFEQLLQTKCCLMRLRITGLRERPAIPDHYLSESKCAEVRGAIIDNGRVVQADSVIYCCTELDYAIMQKCYTWEKFEIGDLWTYRRGYLPKPYIETVLDLYSKKTTLKGVPGAEEDYLLSKEQVNSLYGMMVTDIARPDVVYENDEWGIKPVNIDQAIAGYNDDKRRFLSYLWGVWVTAHARAAIWGYVPGYGWVGGIIGMGDSYIYSDTDSIKCILLGHDKIDQLARYNEICAIRLLTMCKYYDIDPELVHPKTVRGVEKWLGVYDFDGYYDRFKTLGAKRYMTERDGDISITVSGVNKKAAIQYMGTLSRDPMVLFCNGMVFPVLSGGSACGKNLHKYQDSPLYWELTDYLGNTAPVVERSALYIAPTSYTLGMSQRYLAYLSGIRTKKDPR